jgi:hypothetical protein
MGANQRSFAWIRRSKMQPSCARFYQDEAKAERNPKAESRLLGIDSDFGARIFFGLRIFPASNNRGLDLMQKALALLTRGPLSQTAEES